MQRNMKPADDEKMKELTGQILDSATTIHKELGPGLPQDVYHQCMVMELKRRNIAINTHVSVPLIYQGKQLDQEYIIEIIVEDRTILELKAVETILPVHEAEIRTYLRLANMPLGFLINFHVVRLKDGFKKFVNNFVG
jgi:GxxExxY protein